MNPNNPSSGAPQLPAFLQNVKRWQLIAGAAAVLIFIFGLIIYSSFNSIVKDGTDKETRLTAIYQDNQNYLSNFRAGFYEQTGLAEAKSEKMDAILTAAVMGRYEKGSNAAPVGGQVFSAIVEAYPDIKGLDIYDKIVNYIQAGRDGYRNQQSKLLDQLRAYDNWRRGGIMRRIVVPIAGFPGPDLRAEVGGHALTGADAEAKMYDIVVLPEVNDIYASGEDQVLEVPGS